MNSPAYDIATLLQDNGFGSIGVNIFVSDDQPPEQDSIIMVRDTGSFGPDTPRQNVEWPTLQITTREARGQGQLCADKSRSIKNFLKNLTRVSINDVYFAFINQTNGPNYVGLDDVMRPSYTVNINCEREYEY
jgi:hypothetical protein